MNKKGFTLTELLVVVVILGIIAGISIPLIRNLSAGFEKRKYQSYADSVLAAGKLFNDSYSEDLFGHNEYGCAYITYDKLVERKLLNDIEIEGVSCNSDKTYIRVIKQKDKYAYTTYLSCGKKTDGKIEEATLTIPNEIPSMDNEACTGVNTSNLSVTADMTQANGKADKNRKKTKIRITSGTGINSVMSIYAKWSQDENDHAVEGFTKVDFKVKEDQEKSLLNGEIISTQSKELITPSGNGAYFLIVRVDHLEDLHGHKWKNPDNTDSKYVAFGPFVVDNTPPTVTANVYKCDSAKNKTGEITGTYTYTSVNTEYDLSSIQGNVSGWATSSNYPNGVCIDFNVSDNLSIRSSIWEWNDSGFKANASGYRALSDERKTIETYDTMYKTQTISKSLSADGHRYARLTIRDYAGNRIFVDVDVKIDKTGPVSLTINNPTQGKWVNRDVTLTLSSHDELNNVGDYYYSYNAGSQGIGNDGDSQWVKLNGGTNKTSFTTEPWTSNINKETYIRVSDSLGNISPIESTWIKIDKTEPETPILVNPYEDTWTATDVAVEVSSWDSLSGLDEYYYSYSSSPTGKGSDPATQWVKLNGGSKKETFTTEPWTETMGKTTYIAVYDIAGNISVPGITKIKIDKTPPSITKLTNSNKTPNEWINKLTITVESTDAHSGIQSYQYTYNENAPDDQVYTDYLSANNYWRIEPNATTSETLYNSTFEAERDQDVYWRVCDKVGNCSEKVSTHVKIETTKPVCGTTNYTSSKDGSTSGVSGTVACSDTKGTYKSGCKPGTGSFNGLKSTQNVKIYDKAGNVEYCPVTVKSRCIKEACKSYIAPICTAYHNNSNTCNYNYTKDECKKACGYSNGTQGVHYDWRANKVNNNGGTYTITVACTPIEWNSENIGNCTWVTKTVNWQPQAGGIGLFQTSGCCGCCNGGIKCTQYTYYY